MLLERQSYGLCHIVFSSFFRRLNRSILIQSPNDRTFGHINIYSSNINCVLFLFSSRKKLCACFYTSVYYYGLETFSYSSESTASSRGEPLFSSLLLQLFSLPEGNETRRTNGSSRKQNSESRRVALLINYKRRRAAARETKV